MTLAVPPTYGALMTLLHDRAWLAYDDHPGGKQGFPKQRHPVIVVSPEILGDAAMSPLGQAIGVFTTTDWSADLSDPICIDGRRYVTRSPVRITRLAPAGEGIPITDDMVNKYGKMNGPDGRVTLSHPKVELGSDVLSELKARLRKVTRPIATTLAGYEALASRQLEPTWASIDHVPEIELPKTVYELFQTVTKKQNEQTGHTLSTGSDPALLRRLSVDHLLAVFAQAPGAHAFSTPQLLTLVVNAYPALAAECAWRLRQGAT